MYSENSILSRMWNFLLFTIISQMVAFVLVAICFSLDLFAAFVLFPITATGTIFFYASCKLSLLLYCCMFACICTGFGITRKKFWCAEKIDAHTRNGILYISCIPGILVALYRSMKRTAQNNHIQSVDGGGGWRNSKHNGDWVSGCEDWWRVFNIIYIKVERERDGDGDLDEWKRHAECRYILYTFCFLVSFLVILTILLGTTTHWAHLKKLMQIFGTK